VLNPPLQFKFQSALARAATHSRQGSLDHDIPPDSQSSLREAFELLGWAAPAPRAFAFAAACCEATLEGMAPSSVHLGYDGPSVTSELPQRLGKLFMRDRGRSASFVSRSSCPRVWAVNPGRRSWSSQWFIVMSVCDRITPNFTEHIEAARI
jgi:hypothetical protein